MTGRRWIHPRPVFDWWQRALDNHQQNCAASLYGCHTVEMVAQAVLNLHTVVIFIWYWLIPDIRIVSHNVNSIVLHSSTGPSLLVYVDWEWMGGFCETWEGLIYLILVNIWDSTGCWVLIQLLMFNQNGLFTLVMWEADCWNRERVCAQAVTVDRLVVRVGRTSSCMIGRYKEPDGVLSYGQYFLRPAMVDGLFRYQPFTTIIDQSLAAFSRLAYLGQAESISWVPHTHEHQQCCISVSTIFRQYSSQAQSKYLQPCIQEQSLPSFLQLSSSKFRLKHIKQGTLLQSQLHHSHQFLARIYAMACPAQR